MAILTTNQMIGGFERVLGVSQAITGYMVTGTADQIAELLCGPRQHDEHCKGWRWHLYVRDNDRRYQAVKDEVRKMLTERRALENREVA